MSFIHKFRRWLQGSFTCIKCEKEFYIMNFGFGEAICPSCYDGEQPFLFLDDSFLLNRIISLHLRKRTVKSKINETELEYQILTHPQMEELKS